MTPEECGEELQRVLSSATFNGAETPKRLLSYLAGAALAGRSGDLKEYTVGVEAFGKRSLYDPRVDPTVRVQAGKLRAKLAEYYRDEGAADPIRISYPKGHFQLVFESVGQVREQPAGWIRAHWKDAALVVAAVLLAVTAVSEWNRRAARPSAISPVAWTPDIQALWQPLIGDDIPIQISYDSMLFLVVPGWTFRRGGIDDPSDIQTSPALKEFMAKLGNPPLRWESNYAEFGAVQGVFLFTLLLHDRKPALLLKRATSLTWEEIQANHLLYLGVGKSKVKIGELLAKRDFEWHYDQIRNLKPAPGERSEYVSVWNPETSTWTEQYGLISMLPGFHQGRHVFIVGAGSTEGDWAAAEYVTTPKYAHELVSRLRSVSGKMPESYQAIIHIRYSGQVPVEMSYVTHHRLESLSK